jgi:NAD(P)-dependent dehydrogenase (short-subunit alcohol dehydrogenase family)
MTPVAAVTGASSGIGFETAVALADHGYKVVLVVRDPARGSQAARLIARRVPPDHVPRVLVADLEDLGSIALAAQELLASHPRLDVLVNNAGILVPDRALTADGFERTFQVNHLAHFALTRLLDPALRAAPAARVVTVASDLHRRGVFDSDNLNAERRWDPWQAYCNSKLLNVMFAAEFARRLAGTAVTSNAVHPGVVASGFGREMLGARAQRGDVFQPFGAPPVLGRQGDHPTGHRRGPPVEDRAVLRGALAFRAVPGGGRPRERGPALADLREAPGGHPGTSARAGRPRADHPITTSSAAAPGRGTVATTSHPEDGPR